MATYLILNLVFCAVAAVMWLILKPRLHMRFVLITLVTLLVCTAIFDSLLISLHIIDYDYAKTLGLKIGTAPVEDFFYAILAAIMMPAIWTKLGAKHATKS